MSVCVLLWVSVVEWVGVTVRDKVPVGGWDRVEVCVPVSVRVAVSDWDLVGVDDGLIELVKVTLEVGVKLGV